VTPRNLAEFPLKDLPQVTPRNLAEFPLKDLPQVTLGDLEGNLRQELETAKLQYSNFPPCMPQIQEGESEIGR
jgi:hypothetical protein